MEVPFTVTAPGGHLVYGVLHKTGGDPTCGVILVHGLTGDMGSYSQLSVARFLASRGFNVLRFNQYEDLPKARRFHETTIRGHVEDTRLIIEYARACGLKTIFLVGHSLGAVVALLAVDEDVKALLFWEPSGAPAERVREWETRDTQRGLSYLDWRTRVFLGNSWVRDAQSFPDPFVAISKLTIPVKIIAGEHGGVLHHCERYRKSLTRAPEMVVIPGAGHTFLEEGAIEVLCSETLSFLEKHCDNTAQ